MGRGVFWWYAEARPTSGLNVWQNGRYGLFDQTGNLNDAVRVFEEFIDPVVAGDYNSDGTVDAADYTMWRKSLGQTGPDLAADGDHSGDVDLADYDFWRAAFGQAAVDAAVASSIPEPTSWVLLVMAGIGIGLRYTGRPLVRGRRCKT
jgi:hypothetical protein